MPTIGLSKPYFAKYNDEGNIVSYSGGGLLGKYTELNIALNGGEANVFYADDAPAESDQQFTGGTATLTTDDLLAAVMADVLGLTMEEISDVSTADAKWVLFDDDQVVPYLGIGGIIKKKSGGVQKWVAFVLRKTQLANPGISATTQGETISWQTQQLTATIMRDDSEKHRWFQMSTPMDSAADAEAVVKAALNITEAGA